MTRSRTGLGALPELPAEFTDAAALILANAKARYGDGLRMEDDDDGDDDDDDSDDDDDDDDDDDADDKGKGGKDDADDDEDKPLGPKGEKALAEERAENRRLRRELRALRNGKPGDKGGKGGKDDESDEDREARATERARELAKPVLVRSQARTELKDAGLIGSPDRLLRMLDLSDIDVTYTDSGDVEDIDGLEDQIKELKRDYPELFRKRGSGSIDAADRGRDSTKPRTASERQAAMLRGA